MALSSADDASNQTVLMLRRSTPGQEGGLIRCGRGALRIVAASVRGLSRQGRRYGGERQDWAARPATTGGGCGRSVELTDDRQAALDDVRD